MAKFKFGDKVREETYGPGICAYIMYVLPNGIPAKPPRTFSIDEPVYIISSSPDGFDTDGIVDAQMVRESKLSAVLTVPEKPKTIDDWIDEFATPDGCRVRVLEMGSAMRLAGCAKSIVKKAQRIANSWNEEYS
jgi:hypothetical protein